MENIGLYLGVGAVVLAFLSYLVSQIIKFCKMSKDDKRKLLLTYLAGLVTMAEDKIGAGHGAEKLAEVENYFSKFFLTSWSASSIKPFRFSFPKTLKIIL